MNHCPSWSVETGLLRVNGESCPINLLPQLSTRCISCGCQQHWWRRLNGFRVTLWNKCNRFQRLLLRALHAGVAAYQTAHWEQLLWSALCTSPSLLPKRPRQSPVLHKYRIHNWLYYNLFSFHIFLLSVCQQKWKRLSAQICCPPPFPFPHPHHKNMHYIFPVLNEDCNWEILKNLRHSFTKKSIYQIHASTAILPGLNLFDSAPKSLIELTFALLMQHQTEERSKQTFSF